MAEERNSRKVRQGVVVSAANDKTIVVQIEERKQHRVYHKMMTTTSKYIGSSFHRTTVPALRVSLRSMIR